MATRVLVLVLVLRGLTVTVISSSSSFNNKRPINIKTMASFGNTLALNAKRHYLIMHPSDSSAQAVHDSILIVLQNMSKLKTENLAHEATVSPSVRFASHADPLYFTAWGRGRKASSTGL